MSCRRSPAGASLVVLVAWGATACTSPSFARLRLAPPAVAVVVRPWIVVKDRLPERPIGISENVFYSSDRYYPDRRLRQAESLRRIGGRTIRGMEGNIGDFLLWAPPPFIGPDPRLTAYHPQHGYMAELYHPDGSLTKPMDFDEFIATGREAGVTEFFYIIGIDAIRADPAHWQWIVPRALETTVAAAAALARRCREQRLHMWFEIGNETDKADETLVAWTPEAYADVVRQLSRAIKAEYPEARIGINGGFTDDWLPRVIPAVRDDADFVAAHAYGARRKGEIARANVALDAAFREAPRARRWPIAVTETSAYDFRGRMPNDLQHATRNFVRMGVNLSQRRVGYMHFWTDRAADVVDPDAKSAFSLDGDVLPMGRVLGIWNEFLKDQLVAVDRSDKRVNAFATRSARSGAVTVFLANRRASAVPVRVRIAGGVPGPRGDVWAFTGRDGGDRDPQWGPAGTIDVADNTFVWKLPPFAVVVIDVPAAAATGGAPARTPRASGLR